MQLSNKQNIFNQFLAEWGNEFSRIYHILRYISSYPRLAGRFAFYGINDTPERINRSQTEWVALVPQFTHPAEKEFFKPYWVPLEHDGYNLFIDLSSPGFTLFDAQYFPFEPYCWTKKIWFEDISRFLASATDESIDTYAEEKQYKKKWDEEIDALFLKRIELGVAGKIPVQEISVQEIFVPDCEPVITLEQDRLIVSGTNPLFLQLLLPQNFEINLIEFVASEDLTEGLCDKITDVRGLVFYVQSIGNEFVSSYEFLFIPSNVGYIKWENNIFTMSHKDYWLLCHIRSKFLSYQWKFANSI